MTGWSAGEVQETLGCTAQALPDDAGRSLPKVAPLRGSLQAEWKTCGTLTCRCTRGDLHGPYWSLRWREGGRQRRRYVKPSDLERVRAGLAEWRRLHPPARSARDGLAALRWLIEHYPEDWGR